MTNISSDDTMPPSNHNVDGNYSSEQPLPDRAEALLQGLAKRSISPNVINGMIRASDVTTIILSALFAYGLYVGPMFQLSLTYGLAIAALSALGLVIFHIMNVNSYSNLRHVSQHGLRVAGAWSVVFFTGLAILVFLQMGDHFSRIWLALTYVIGLITLLLERGVASVLIRRLSDAGKIERRIVIVGGGESGELLLNNFRNSKQGDLHVLGFFDDRNDRRSNDELAGYPKLGNVDDLVKFARRTHLDLIIFSLPITAEMRLLQMLRKLWVLPIDIRLAAHMNKLRLRPRSYSYVGDVPVLDVFDKPIAEWDVVLKALFDRVAGFCLLVLLAPLMALIALGVKFTSPGPVFFRQVRHGFNNEHIIVYKFRTMYAEQLDHSAQKQVKRGDTRVTPFGRFLRRSSLDELPQLFNVAFIGDLSLVGPRPHAVGGKATGRVYDEVVDGYFARHRVKPGITGWAQVNGWRGETDTPEKMQARVEHDLSYIENWSIFFDLYILLLTPIALIKGKNAY